MLRLYQEFAASLGHFEHKDINFWVILFAMDWLLNFKSFYIVRIYGVVKYTALIKSLKPVVPAILDFELFLLYILSYLPRTL